MRQYWGLLEGAWNRKHSKASLELGGGRSPKNAKGVQGQSWKNSETALEQKTGHPLTSPLACCILKAWEMREWKATE